MEEPNRTDSPNWWLAALGTVGALALIFFLGVGYGQEWGAPQWGPLAEWLAGGFTFAAVVVALRAAIYAQRESARAERSRLVDHELQRRRENIRSLSGLWAAIVSMGIDLASFTAYMKNLPPTFDPNRPRSDIAPPEPGDIPGEPVCYQFGRVYQTFADKWFQTIEPPLFSALAILNGSALDEAVKSLNVKLREITEKCLPLLSADFARGRRPDVTAIETTWKDAGRRRQAHLDLARQHFSLKLDDVEQHLFG
ncbi:hypothetical protein GCM10009641_26970 [Mycobacterium cookii]|uniref:Uncharacterized protein n=2 Tax=Mycobacterium cookii TaxID=1775 RepID=A0A7I7KTM8_9MYCO|nr:hypothetical protein MCOO_07270 [Mycobacterium cookii]